MLPSQKSSANFQRSLAQAIIFPTVILALLAAVLVVQILSLLSLANWVDHTDQVIAQTTITQKLILDQQVGRRGYLIGGNPKFLEPYLRSQIAIGPAFDHLERLVADNPRQEGRLRVLRLDYARWAANSSLEMALFAHNPAAGRRHFNQGIGKGLMDNLGEKFTAFLSTEQSLRAARQSEAQGATHRTLIGLAVLAVVTGLLLGIVIVRQIQRVTAQFDRALRESLASEALIAATLRSIGDAILVTDAQGRIIEMNPVAEELTGWTLAEARGLESGQVFTIVNETTRLPVENPLDRVLREGLVVGLANHTVLLRRDASEVPIDNSGAPIRTEAGELAGSVLVFRDITERRLTEQKQAAVYEQEHRIAESLQRSLLGRPSSESLGGLTVETFYRPAWSEAQVGGDFYDIFVLDEGKVALVVGDVSGKGLLAASRTAEAKFTLRAYLREYTHAANALTRLNAFLCEAKALEAEAAEYFVCLTLAVVIPGTGRLDIAAAGMEPPLIFRSTGQAEEVKISGMPLGISAKFEYEAVQNTLATGEFLVITTDGITEARQGSNMLGIDGVARLAAEALPDTSLQSVGRRILEGAQAYAGGQLRDDACLLLAGRGI